MKTNLKDMELEKYKNQGLTKFLSSQQITDIYPVIEKVDVYEVPEMDRIILRIYVKDPDMTQENMYKKGLDPHYLVDYHLNRLVPYFSIPKNQRYGFVVVSPEGEKIHGYLD